MSNVVLYPTFIKIFYSFYLYKMNDANIIFYNQMVDMIKLSNIDVVKQYELIEALKAILIEQPPSKPPVFGYVW